MDKLIKYAINKDSSSFITHVKLKLEEMYDEKKQEIRTNKINSINESDNNILANYGVSEFNPGLDYIPSTPTSFVAVTDDIAREIEKRLTDLKVKYVRTGQNFIITAA